MNVIVDNNICIHNPSKYVLDYCKSSLVLDNPEYYKKERLGRWTGNVPKQLHLYEKKGDTVVVPFGCLKDIWKLCGYADWKVKIKPVKGVEYGDGINMFDYQEKAVTEALRHKNGILVMPCGSGKTNCGIEIIRRVKGKALWLTHTQELLTQSMSRAKSIFDLPDTCYGTITAGKVNIGTHITFATVQTMCKIDLDAHKNDFDIIIIDECQHLVGTPTRITQFYKVVNSLSARYKIGLTATPKRADGLERAMFALCGDVICEIDKSAIADYVCPVRVEKVYTGYTPDVDNILDGDGTLNYAKLVDDLIHNEKRFNFVLSEIEKLPKSEPILVLANRVEYLSHLNNAYGGRSLFLSALTKKMERKEALEALNNGDIDCLFATYQLAKEGLDVPKLRYVVFATPEKNEVTVIQSAGRVGRKAEGKEYGTVIDFVDDFSVYKNWSKKRDSFYKKTDIDIIV